jgi:hypothetical protein
MLRNAAALVMMLICAGVSHAQRDEFELEDTISIVVIDRELLANAANGGSSKLRLEVGERVIWSGARGRIGFVLTDRRVLGFHRRTGWSARQLRVAEVTPSRPQMSTRLALFVTSLRAIVFDGHWREESIGPQERVRTVSAGSGAALVVTNRRALGLSPGSSGFVAVELRIHETVEDARAVASSAEVRTSQRVLFFNGSWSEERLSLN